MKLAKTYSNSAQPTIKGKQLLTLKSNVVSMKAKSFIRAQVVLMCFAVAATLAAAQTAAILVVPQNLDPTQQVQTVNSTNQLTVNFHNQKTGTASVPETMTLWNISSTTVTGLSAQITTGKFTISSSNWSTCLPANCLGPGQHATIQVTFNSSAAGSFSSTLSFTSTTTGLIPIPSVKLTGTAVTPPSSVPFSVNAAYAFHGIGQLNNNTVADGDLYFGNQSIGATTCGAKVYLSNGTATSVSVTASLSPSTGPFAISVQPPTSITAGVNTASLGITYTPTGTSGDTATLNVKFAGVATQSLMLHGTGFTTNPTSGHIPFIDMGNTTPQNGYLGAYTGGLFDGNFGPSGDTGCNSPTSYVTSYPTNNLTGVPQDTIGRAMAALIQPINGTTGLYDGTGNAVLLSFGMSNASDEWCGYGSAVAKNGAGLCGSPGFTNTPSTYSFMQQANTQNEHGIIMLNQHLAIVNGAISSQEACDYTVATPGAITPPAHCAPFDVNKSTSNPISDYDAILEYQLSAHNPVLHENQVQAIWLKEADVKIIQDGLAQPFGPLPTECPTQSQPADAYNLETNLGKIVRAAKIRYPNLRMVFLTSRSYGGFTGFCPTDEPYAYETGFANKWLVKAQIDQMNNGGTAVDTNGGDLNYLVCTPTTNCTTAAPEAPFVIWDRLPGTNPNNVFAGSTYIWAYTNPSSPYTYYPNSDDTIWPFDGNKMMATCTPPAMNNYFSDGQHPNDCGINQVGGNLLLNYFLESPYTNPWFTSH